MPHSCVVVGFYSCNSTSDITRFFSFHFAVAEISSPTKYRWHISECINVATTQRTEFEHDATREIKRRWWSHSNSTNNNVQLNAREPNRHSTSSINKSMNNRQQCHLYSSHFFHLVHFFFISVFCLLFAIFQRYLRFRHRGSGFTTKFRNRRPMKKVSARRKEEPLLVMITENERSNELRSSSSSKKNIVATWRYCSLFDWIKQLLPKRRKKNSSTHTENPRVKNGREEEVDAE